ncbi:MAG: hypothetical protein AB1830_12920 [Pseudomonadota bacterium]
MRQRVYPRWVAAGKMTREKADAEIAAIKAVLESLEAINRPELDDFMAAVVNEARHQRARWGAEHDAGKSPEDWLWLVAYLATKAAQAHRYGDRGKYLHHIITTAAACLNWHAYASGQDALRPEADPSRHE